MKITKVQVSNYKSLKEISIKGFLETNMIFGMNNSGKSNFLKLLELIFKRKRRKEVVRFQEGTEEVEEEVELNTTNFWEGYIYSSPYLYWKDEDNSIKFTIRVEVSKDELTGFNEKLYVDLDTAGFFEKLTSLQFEFIGEIKKAGGFDSEIVLNQVNLGIKPIFNLSDDGLPEYFPEDTPIFDKHSEQGFYDLVTNFNDCVELIDSDRYFKKELFQIESENILLSPGSLKNWLYEKHLNSKSYDEFQELQVFLNEIEIGANILHSAKGKLDNFPMNKIQIGFSKFEDELEIMLTTTFGRLPLKNHGTGVQQVIYLFTKIFESNSKIILIEEAELNLSHEYQRIIIHNMNRLVKIGRINQFIFTSHSDVFKRNDFPHFEVTIDEKGASNIAKTENMRTSIEKIVKGVKSK